MRSCAGLSGAVLALLLVTGCRAVGAKEEELPFALDLEFHGEVTVDEPRLEEIVRRELVRLEVSAPDKAAVDDAAFAIERFYRARGYADVEVDYEFDPVPGGTPRASFQVREGPQVHVRGLVIEGASAFSEEKVRGYLGDAASGGVYDEAQIAEGLGSLRKDYLEAGHLRVEIEDPAVELEAGQGSVSLRIVIHEGPAFTVKALEIEGGIPEMEEREKKAITGFTDKAFQPVMRREIEHRLVGAYQRRGYPDAQVAVTSEVDEATGEVRITARITPGDHVKVAHFRIEGNERTKDAAILDTIGIELGSSYDSELVREGFQRLYATGLFESATLELEGKGEERTLVVRVVEARSVEIRLEPGWGSYEGPRFLIGIQEKNFMGRGQVVELEGTVSLKAQSLSVGWIDRDFLGSDYTSEVNAFVEQRQEPSFEFVRRGLGFFLRRKYGRDWSTSYGYEYRPTNVLEDDVVSPLDEDSNVAALSAVVTLDDRDYVLLPTTGKRVRARLEWADDGFGSDTEFLRAQLDYTQCLRIGSRAVLAAGARTGVIAPFGNTDEIPVTERFFNGGENTVRSFKEDELLPAGTTGDPQGGETATTLNLELRRMITDNLAGALFFDYGNLTEVVQDYFDFPGFRSGVGVGLRYALPIGPVRLDFGVNPDPKDGEDEAVLHFSVGFPF